MTDKDNGDVPISRKTSQEKGGETDHEAPNSLMQQKANSPDAESLNKFPTENRNNSESDSTASGAREIPNQKAKSLPESYEVSRIMMKDRKMPWFYSLEPPNSKLGRSSYLPPCPTILPTDSIHTTGPALSTRIVSLDGPIQNDSRIVCPKVRVHLLDVCTGTYYDIRQVIHPADYPPNDPIIPESDYLPTCWGDLATPVPPLPSPRQGTLFETFPALNPSLRTHARLLHEAGMYPINPSQTLQGELERCTLVFGDTFVFPITTLEILRSPSAVLVFELVEHAIEDSRGEVVFGWGYIRLSSILGTSHFPNDTQVPLGFPDGFAPPISSPLSSSNGGGSMENNVHPISIPLFEAPQVTAAQLKQHVLEVVHRHQQFGESNVERSQPLLLEDSSSDSYTNLYEYIKPTISPTRFLPLPIQPPPAAVYFRNPNPVPTLYSLQVMVFSSIIPRLRIVKSSERGMTHTIPRIKGPNIVQPANRTACSVHPVLHRPPHLITLPTDLPASAVREEKPAEADDMKHPTSEDFDKTAEDDRNSDYESDEDESLLFSKLPQPILRPSRNRRYLDPCRAPTILLGTLPSEKQGASALSFSPDGTLLAVATCMERGAGFGEGFPIRIFAVGPDVPDIYCGRLLASLEGHTGLVYSLQWSPDGTHLVSAAADGSVYLWQLPRAKNGWMIRTTSRPIARLAHMPLTYVYSAKFVPFALQYIVTASYFGGVRLWHIPDSCFEHGAQRRPIGATYPLSIDASVHDVPIATCLGSLQSEIHSLGETFHDYTRQMNQTGGHLGRSLLGATGNFLWFPNPEHEDGVSFTARDVHRPVNPTSQPYVNCIEFDTACYEDGGTRCLVAGDSHGQIQVWICPDPNVDLDDGIGFSETRAKYQKSTWNNRNGETVIPMDGSNPPNTHLDTLELTPDSFLCHKACLIAEDSPILDIRARPALGCKGHPQILLLIQGQPLLLLDLETFGLLRHFTISPPLSTRVGATWSPDGMYLACGHQDGVLRMWNGHDSSAIPVLVNARKEKHQELQKRAMGKAQQSDGAPVGYPISLLQVAWNDQAHQVAVVGFGSGYPVLVVS